MDIQKLAMCGGLTVFFLLFNISFMVYNYIGDRDGNTNNYCIRLILCRYLLRH